ncbi:MAG: biopolymer transporter ExbD [Planctomycetales bacterium]|nr:biopolymer transporter ExbD [Planctomycetales bacterium]
MPIKTQQDEQPSLNMTPMIDIVFLLVIFFMVGTKFTEMERTIKLEVPRVKNIGALTAAPEKRLINVFRNGTITMDDQDFASVEQLESVLRESVREYPDLGVIIRGDGEGPLQNVATVLTACRSAGINDMGISVQRDTKLR